MTEIQNSKPFYDPEEITLYDILRIVAQTLISNVLVIEYWNLRFICNLELVI
jgi:hypothetical protein